MSGYSQARRNELARQLGFASYAQRRRFSHKIDNREALASLPPGAREARQAALDAVATARRERIDLSEAARREGIPVHAVAWWAGDVVARKGNRWGVSRADRLYRPMYVYSGGRVVPIDVRGSQVASTIGSYHSAVQHYLHSGDPSRLARFAGRRVGGGGGVELETDLEVIDELARRGEFDFESIYRMVES